MDYKLYSLLTGRAGTGKTTLVRAMIDKNPDFGILCASTGIAAVNLGTSTIHSLLGYFDTDGLSEKFLSGALQTRLRRIQKHTRVIILDEVSMLPGEQLDIICDALDQVNEGKEEDKRLGLMLCGDFGQLAPVKAKWAFEAENWPKFQPNIKFLTKIWRQDNLGFIEALNFAREGNGEALYELLKKLNVEVARNLDQNFKGTTIFAKNEKVDAFNMVRLMQLQGERVTTRRELNGKVYGEWEKVIPEEFKAKIGAYVMILVNKSLGMDFDTGLPLGFEYSNGDCGYIRDYLPATETFLVELVRNGNIVEIPKLTRYLEVKQKPDEFSEIGKWEDGTDYEPWKNENGKWVLGQVTYTPLRLAWASTVHKCLSKNTFVLKKFEGIEKLLPVRLEDTQIGDRIKGLNGLVTIKAKENVGIKSTLKIVIGDGLFTNATIFSSFEHRFPVYNYKNSQEFDLIEAQNLRIGDTLKVLVRNSIVDLCVQGIKKVMGSPPDSDMIDIEVDKDNLFIANGILTHNSQGLSLDMIQGDIKDHFFGYANMLYVFLSRARTLKGLKIVAHSDDMIIKRCNVDAKVLRWFKSLNNNGRF